MPQGMKQVNSGKFCAVLAQKVTDELLESCPDRALRQQMEVSVEAQPRTSKDHKSAILLRGLTVKIACPRLESCLTHADFLYFRGVLGFEERHVEFGFVLQRLV